ncbi:MULTISPECIES: hemerythrin domain-containing protein [Leptolyngbya]|jgi:hemerythrin superfamily protein|uniref:Hemerythrin hhE cation-binding domain-containing protein n=2 Tax=Leptolyngbya boryana TaxID=1184 RepID=A0A1Z4JJ46_LEPBY|nr:MULTISPECIES: hemerythrin domain-containing protein [Leptolyngbya]BAY56577.1 hemerythrin hhE cation-binding domain-containing protein [Leptolyngbya boryana NIES-2135]MBD1857735.1 hemerythrin domain-containing protein [Leptolyngbya sp. FACHB-1624]MBD2369882.1 hemerythrin domain-containing protein [Leptolyngbya sp. FACHB-161]MBD2376173.1 hemerythrin domain-containing protein [Leptolyngbya sp. FACHB-238]MBD2400448.1 hemerythrin domain-containing protein [Leptolyngbya sp. FACHB-239]
MVTTVDDTKRKAIAMKLADMKAVQELIISNEQKFISATTDSEIAKRFQEMLKDDQKNLGILDTVIVQYGVPSEPKQTISEFVSKMDQMMSGSELTMYEKVFQHELMKHQQVMTGITIHKAAQRVGADIEAAITPLNTVNFENRAHQEQLKGVLETLGVRELTGMDADQGLWSRVQDAVAALSGVAGSVVTQASGKSDMNIQDVIRMDHQKVNVLFAEIKGTQDQMKRKEFFTQLASDLRAHAIAENEIAYPAVRGKYAESDLQELYDEQNSWFPALEAMEKMDMMSDQFMSALNKLMDEIMDHVRQEESTFFAALRDNFSSSELENLATQFKARKSEVQKAAAK